MAVAEVLASEDLLELIFERLTARSLLSLGEATSGLIVPSDSVHWKALCREQWEGLPSGKLQWDLPLSVGGFVPDGPSSSLSILGTDWKRRYKLISVSQAYWQSLQLDGCMREAHRTFASQATVDEVLADMVTTVVHVAHAGLNVGTHPEYLSYMNTQYRLARSITTEPLSTGFAEYWHAAMRRYRYSRESDPRVRDWASLGDPRKIRPEELIDLGVESCTHRRLNRIPPAMPPASALCTSSCVPCCDS
jgi:hypothetical protein